MQLSRFWADLNVCFECCTTLGAELVLTPKKEGVIGAIARAEELLAENPGSVIPSQFTNPSNPEIHKKTRLKKSGMTPTAKLIWSLPVLARAVDTFFNPVQSSHGIKALVDAGIWLTVLLDGGDKFSVNQFNAVA